MVKTDAKGNRDLQVKGSKKNAVTRVLGSIKSPPHKDELRINSRTGPKINSFHLFNNQPVFSNNEKMMSHSSQSPENSACAYLSPPQLVYSPFHAHEQPNQQESFSNQRISNSNGTEIHQVDREVKSRENNHSPYESIETKRDLMAPRL
jgi:hypothetical protein